MKERTKSIFSYLFLLLIALGLILIIVGMFVGQLNYVNPKAQYGLYLTLFGDWSARNIGGTIVGGVSNTFAIVAFIVTLVGAAILLISDTLRLIIKKNLSLVRSIGILTTFIGAILIIASALKMINYTTLYINRNPVDISCGIGVWFGFIGGLIAVFGGSVSAVLDDGIVFGLKHFKNIGMPVKVTVVTDINILTEMPENESYLVWVANYNLAKRYMAYILISLAIIIIGTVASIVRLSYVVMPLTIGFTIVSMVTMSYWKKLLEGFATFCNIKGFPKMGIYTPLFYFSWIFSRIMSLLMSLIIFVISLITTNDSSNSGSKYRYFVRLGLPQNMGYDKIIEFGLTYDDALSAANLNAMNSTLLDLEHNINKSILETNYTSAKNSLNDISEEIKKTGKLIEEFSKHENILSSENKDKLFKIKQKSIDLKTKVDDSKKKLEEINEQAKDGLEESYNAGKAQLKDDYDQNIKQIFESTHSKYGE